MGPLGYDERHEKVMIDRWWSKGRLVAQCPSSSVAEAALRACVHAMVIINTKERRRGRNHRAS